MMEEFQGKIEGLIQESQTIENPDTRNWEIRAILQAMEETVQQKGWIITYEQEETIEQSGKVFHVMPAYKFVEAMDSFP